jgi:erythromycin esterase-like protein
LTFDSGDYDPLLQWIGNRRMVLIGEASHGTHDSYRERALITRRLIEEKGFNAVAIEGDWPDAARVRRFVRGGSKDVSAREALGDFERFPAWMWRNMDVLAFVDWLYHFNRETARQERVGFYGLDLYSLHASIRAVLDYMDKVDPEGAQRARYRYACFDHFGEDTQAYGYAASFGLSRGCEDEVVAQLVEMRRRSADLTSREGQVEPDDLLFAEQNARLVQNAEHYYRAMFSGRAESSNVRDEHMAETLAWLRRIRPERLSSGPTIRIWAMRVTRRCLRVANATWAQLMRERFDEDVFLIGFTPIPEKLPPPHNGKLQQKEKSFVLHWKGVMKRSSIRRAFLPFYSLCMTMM